MHLATLSPVIQKQNTTILEAGLRALAQMTQEEFEGLKLILKTLIEKQPVIATEGAK